MAKSFDIKVIHLDNKPYNWLGKNWACKIGADISKGELLLFVDADVKIENNSIKKLLYEYEKNKCTISVKPYHKMKKPYEQFSLFFNFIEIGANGFSLPIQKPIGLYGPIILIPKKIYNNINGHENIKNSIVDDLDLGLNLKKKNYLFKLFIGKKDISYRMYGTGIIDMVNGWTKNFATGASKTPFYIFFMIFIWMSSLISVPMYIIIFATISDYLFLILYSFLYLCWVIFLSVISKKIGDFKTISCIFYPIFLLFFLIIFLYSILKKIFKLHVTWKNRKIIGGEKCR